MSLRAVSALSLSCAFSVCFQRELHFFPTRRSSDLLHPGLRHAALPAHAPAFRLRQDCRGLQSPVQFLQDRKSTRLNSSHLVISYAVFCLTTKSNSLFSQDFCLLLDISFMDWIQV